VTQGLVREAREILSTAPPGGDRRELAWAAGVWNCRHAMALVGYWRGSAGPRGLATSPHSGSSLERGRWILATYKRIEVYGGDLDRPLIIGWPDIAALIDTARTKHLDACRAALNERGEFLRRHGFHSGMGEWWAVEDRCYAAGLAAWAACRPMTRQLDLFGLLDT